jgi:hypothetical protein
MPSVSKKQEKFMRAVAHSPKFAKKVGVPVAVGKEYEAADKARKKRKAKAKSAAVDYSTGLSRRVPFKA